MKLFPPDPTETIIGLISFLILLGVMAKLLIPRISATLADRANAIEGGLERGRKAQDAANAKLAEYRAERADARHEAARLREEATEEGAQIVAEMRQRGQAEFDRLVAASKSQIEADKEQALISLRAEVGAIAVELAGKIVGEPPRR